MDNTQVLIAGAGPVGMTLALALSRQGAKVRIIDKSAGRTDKSKALVMWPRTLELFDIEGCVKSFLDAGMQGHRVRIASDGKNLLQASFSLAKSSFPYALMIPQNETERVLEEQLASRGVHVERNTELKSFVDDGNGVSATLLGQDGTVEEVRAAYLAGCDGAHSVVRKGIGAQFTGTSEPSGWVLADMMLDGDVAPDEILINWTRHGVLAIFPIVGNRYRVIADVPADEGDVSTPLELDRVQKVLDERGPGGLRAHDPFWLSRFRINERKVHDYAKGRCFLVGDAAHIHSPAGGQGMNTGMQDAFNLAWKLALAVNGQAGPKLLATYSQERSAIGDQVLRNASMLTHVATVGNPFLQKLRNVAVSALGDLSIVQQRLVDQLAEIDLSYHHSDLGAPHNSVAHKLPKGNRVPDVAVVSQGAATRLYAVLRSGRFVLLTVGAEAAEVPAALHERAISATAVQGGAFEEGLAYLIRPDSYLVGSATVAGALDLLGTLQPFTTSGVAGPAP